MNEELKTTLAEYLKKLLSLVEQGAQAAAQQVPLIIQEKLRYDLVMESVYLVVVFPLLILCIWWIWRGVRNVIENEDPEYYMPNFTVGGVLGVVTLILTLAGVGTIVKIVLAPRLYIVEWLKGML